MEKPVIDRVNEAYTIEHKLQNDAIGKILIFDFEISDFKLDKKNRVLLFVRWQ